MNWKVSAWCEATWLLLIKGQGLSFLLFLCVFIMTSINSVGDIEEFALIPLYLYLPPPSHQLKHFFLWFTEPNKSCVWLLLWLISLSPHTLPTLACLLCCDHPQVIFFSCLRTFLISSLFKMISLLIFCMGQSFLSVEAFLNHQIWRNCLIILSHRLILISTWH